ncbi:MAG: hypothetical protein V3U89_09405 [Methylophilaceae bacterium]
MSGHVFAKVEEQQKIKIYVTVDWEGMSLDEENIAAMQAFRKKFPHVSMLQLLNPSYFLRDHPDNAHLTSLIKSTFLPIDTQGLHVHAWKSLTDYCGVKYQHTHSFADVDESCKTGDCGYTISLENAYSQSALTKLIACSNRVLVKNGFNKSVHFRAGGWQLGSKLIAALEADGFVWDSSEIDADLLTTRWHESSSMVRMLRQLHPKRTPLDQPYALTAKLTEYPNNAALADYTTTLQLVTMFRNLITSNKRVMVLGFHQETAADFLGRIEKAIPQMEAIAKKKNIQIDWISK